MKINRKDLHATLTISQKGLTKREILAQSNAFIFAGDSLITFNGEVLTRTKNPLDIQGAVPADDLLALLAKLPDDEVEVIIKGEELVVKGVRRAAGITRCAEIELPYDDVPTPKTWNEVPQDLMKVLLQGARVCGKDETQPRTTEIHVTEDLIEACDNFRLFRYMIDTKFKKEVLIPASSLESVGNLKVTHVDIRKGWVHFKTPSKHIVSIRCSSGEYPDLGPMMKLKDPEKVRLPKNLGEILSRAEVMHETAYDARVNITIAEGKLILKAAKESGWYRETKRVKYEGAPLKFSVHPAFLGEVLKKTNQVLIGGNRIKFEAGNEVFIVCLEVVE